MATAWHTRLAQRKDWLLTNGEVITEPLLEESPTGARVRLPGDPTSYYKRDAPRVLVGAVEAEARKRKAQIWMPVDLEERSYRAQLGAHADPTPAALDLTTKDSAKAGVIRPRERQLAWAYWEFRHPTLPFVSRLTIRVWQDRSANTHVAAGLLFSDTTPNTSRNPSYKVTTKPDFSDHFDWLASSGPVVDVNQRLAGILGGRGSSTERVGIQFLHDALNIMSEVDTILIPDLRNIDSPTASEAWLEIEQTETNVSGQFMADVRDYLEDGDALGEVLEAYVALQSAFRGIGLVLPESLNENQLHRALTRGEELITTFSTKPTSFVDEGRNSHAIAVNLATGTFAVQCPTTAAKEEIAHDWEESLLRASLLNQEDQLLAYARAHAERNLARRTKTLVKQRTNKKSEED